MEDEYDVVVLGTGLKESILSGLMSVNGKKVLHVDRNSHYGGESASLNLNQLFEKFKPEGTKANESVLGKSKYYNVDLCPKFIMACGNLVKILLQTQVTRYLQFKSVAGSYVFKDDSIHKVPATPGEAWGSGLMGIFQKNRFRIFLQYCAEYDQSNPSTFRGCDATKFTTREAFEYWKLDENTQAFTGHAIALNQNDDYLNEVFTETLRKIQLYAYSVSRYGNSPYIYPVWGLGGLPEGFSRLSAVHGGVYMLNKPVDEIVYEDGKVSGVRSGDEIARCKVVIGDPSYFSGSNQIKKTGQIARWIFILNHPLPKTNGAHSVQIIIPFKHTGRKTDVYISCISGVHEVAAKGKYVAMVSAVVETPNPRRELDFTRDLIGDFEES